MAHKKMGLPITEVVGIEDTPAGIEALKAAGIYSIGLHSSHTLEEIQGADIVIEKLTDLLS